ncbi:MAG TPA: hemerythrin domain-containing protein [Ferrovibrio sp.]|uniref:hemerythrin domain-containing protein n=1 Tax=Ferrovibrio sp. TaxID=1917215 RepID=UPI002ED1E338
MARRTQTKSKSRTAARAGTKRAATTRRKPAAASRSATRRKSAAPRKPARRRGRLTVTPAMKKIARQMSQMVAEQTVPADATALLKQDHREVESFFEQYEQLDSKAEKGKLAAKICLMLTVHAMIEEELLYPAAHEESEAVESDLVDEAIVEHASAKQLIAEIEAMKPGEELYDAKVKVLGEYVKHHVKEEENELFPQLQDSELDLRELGEKLMQRKIELLAQMTGKA